MGAGGDDAAIEGIDEVGDFRGGAGGDFLDGGQAVLLVAGVDAFGAVAAVEDVLFRLPHPLPGPPLLVPHPLPGPPLEGEGVVAEAGVFFEDGDADFFGGAGVDGGFVDDDGAFGHDLADGFGGLDQRGEVGALGVVDGGGYGDDEDIAAAQLFRVGGEAELAGCGEFGGFDFTGAVAAGLEFVDAALLDVEAGDRVFLAEFNGQRQADVAQADYGDAGVC